MPKSSKKRSLVKALTWRVTATADTFLISYLVILKSDFSVLETAGLIAALEVITKVTIYSVSYTHLTLPTILLV